MLACLGALRVRDRIGARGVLRQAGEHRRFGQRQIIEGLAEVAARGARKAVRTLAKIDLVHVQLEDLVLGERILDLVGQRDLGELARDRLLVRQEEIAGDLHRDGRSALAKASAQVGPRGAGCADEVDAAVFVEAGVFDGQHRAFHHRRDLRDRHEVAVLDAELPDQHIVERVNAQRDLRAVVGDGIDRRHLGADRAPYADRQADCDDEHRAEENEDERVHALHAEQGFAGLLVGDTHC